MTQWLLDAKSLRPQATMPQFFDSTNADDRQTASDIAAYLTSMSSNDEHLLPIAKGDPQEGRTLYENLGCLACHHLEKVEETDDYHRLPLRNVAFKFLPGQIEAFLSKPESHFPRTRMPNFQSSTEEARHLATYFRELPATTIPEFPTGNGDRGRIRGDAAEMLCLS